MADEPWRGLHPDGRIEERPNRLILDPYHVLDFLTDSGGKRIGAIVTHRDPDTEHDPEAAVRKGGSAGWCAGSIFWDGRDGPRWTLEKEDPLTLSPSIQCSVCPDNGMTHGHVTEGKWVPAGALPEWAS